MADDIELHVQVARPSYSSPADGLAGLIAAPSSSTSHSEETVAAPVSSALPALSSQPVNFEFEANQTPNILEIPSAAVNTAAQVAKVISVVVKPVPWLGPAVELVASIFELYKNVGKNRFAAEELYIHCERMVQAVNQGFNNSSSESVKGMVQELERLFQRIRDDFKEWMVWNKEKKYFLKAVAKQDVIAEAIRSYHVDIDQFSKRYVIATQNMIVNWLEAHDRQSRKDSEELKRFFLENSEENTRYLQDMCQKQDTTNSGVTGVQEDVSKILHFLKLLVDQHPDERWKLEENISTICLSSEVLPPGIKLIEAHLQWPRDPMARDKTYSIYQGLYDGRSCAIKMLTPAAYSAIAKRRFMRQLLHWSSLDVLDEGNHILPLIGAVVRDDSKDTCFAPGFSCFVSPWMKGDALQLGEDVDRIKICLNIAKGLKILHTHNPPLFHGALKASNILIDNFGRPVLSGFGLLRAIDQEPISVDSYPADVMAYRWFPPEMVAGLGYEGDEAPDLTTKSDIFMYGMTVLEIMTGEKPFFYLKRDPYVLFRRKKGELPQRPQGENAQKALRRGLHDQLWELLLLCWSDKPENRPTIVEVIEALETMPSSL